VFNALLPLPSGKYAMVTDPRTSHTVEPHEGQPHQWLLDEAPPGAARPDQYVAFVTDASGQRHYSHGRIARWRRTGRFR
jgi:hypothetical protein